MKTSVLYSLVMVAILGAQASAMTTVGGLILTNTQWTLAGSPYVVNQSIIIGAGATLTIDPGVVVEFQSSIGMVIGSQPFGSATLIARGTVAQPIIFTANGPGAPGAWNQLLFADEAVDAVVGVDGSYQSGSVLEQCIVEFGGNGTPQVTFQQSSPRVKDTIIRQSANKGLKADLAGGITATPKLWMTGCTIESCATGGVEILNGTGHQVRENTLVNNSGSNALSMAGCDSSEIADNMFQNNAGYGCSISSCPGAIVARNTAANSSGTGIGVFSSQNAIVTGNRLTTNQSGLLVQSCTGANITDNLISANGPTGGMYLAGGTSCVVSGNTFSNNAASNGGGLQVYAGSNNVISSNCFATNTASQTGGGLHVNSGTATVTGCSFASNIAQTKGGGIHASGTVTFNDNVIVLNQAPEGGGIYVNSAGVQLAGNPASNSFNTIVNNTATTGPALYHNVPFAANGSGNLDATYIDWGTTDLGSIPPMIWDYFDNANLGIVGFINATVGVVDKDPIHDLGCGSPGFNGIPELSATGTLMPGSPAQFSLTNSAPSTLALVVFGLSPLYFEFEGCLLVPAPWVMPVAPIGPSGNLNFGVSWPAFFGTGDEVFFQILIQDPGAPNGIGSFSNALYLVTQ